MDIERFYKGKNVLVTGAAGFIGSHLSEALLKTAGSVKAFVRYNSRNDWGYLEDLPADEKASIQIIAADLRDSQAVRKATQGVDIVFHLGASIGIPYSLEYPNDVIDTNVMGTLNVLKASLENLVERVIHTSTSEVYGTAQYTPIDEKHPLSPQSPYAASKIAADKLAESFHRAYNLPVAIIRPFNTFGPRQSLRAIIPTIISQLIKGRVVRAGNLTPKRDFTFVLDTVKGFLLLAGQEGVEGRTYNLGTKQDITISELIYKIADLMHITPEVQTDPDRVRGNQSEVMRLISDNSQAQKVFGWSPDFSLEKGLVSVIQWMREKPLNVKSGFYTI